MATRVPLEVMLTDYQAEHHRAVKNEAAGGVNVAKRVAAGEQFDIVILAADSIDTLLRDGHLAGSRTDLMRSGIAVAVRKGEPQPDISSERALKDLVRSTNSLSYSTGPSGVYLERLFERWGLSESVKGRVIVPPPGVPVASLVASGQSQIGFQQLSELIDQPDVLVVGSLPPDVQMFTTFCGAIGAQSASRAAGEGLLGYLASDSRLAVKRRYGMNLD
jgi:molybdate transport system substrate-binding protein